MTDDAPFPRTQYFGPRWDAPRLDGAVAVPTPVGETCLFCSEAVAEGDQGFLMMAAIAGAMHPVHRECELANVLSHAAKACHCYEPDLGVRESGPRTLAWIESAALVPLLVEGAEGLGDRAHEA